VKISKKKAPDILLMPGASIRICVVG